MSLVLKRLPTDFCVEELTRRGPTGGGYGLYRLTKTSLGTPEAVDLLLRKWNLKRHQVQYGGLKDKHAHTVQHLTIRGGPARGLTQPSLTIEYLGQTDRPFASADIVANRFDLRLRNLTPDQAATIEERFAGVARSGLPNYFDDQRFGSLGRSGEFVAAAWCRGDFERALWLALADANAHDDGDERREKETLCEAWGNWGAAKAQLARSHRRSIVSYLADHPSGFKKAFGLIRADLRGLYLSALQSAIWNDALAALVRLHYPADSLREMELACGPVPFPLPAASLAGNPLDEQSLPLASARAKLPPGPIADAIRAAAAKQGLTLEQMRIRYPDDSFFSRGERAAWLRPAKAEAVLAPDDVYAGRHLLRIQFELPRGAYATMVVKAIA